MTLEEAQNQFYKYAMLNLSGKGRRTLNNWWKHAQRTLPSEVWA